jgi:hypothetical protein
MAKSFTTEGNLRFEFVRDLAQLKRRRLRSANLFATELGNRLDAEATMTTNRFLRGQRSVVGPALHSRLANTQ